MKNIKGHIKILALVFAGLAFVTCSRQHVTELGPREYVDWFGHQKEGQIVKKINNVEFSLTYLPADYMLLLNNPDAAMKGTQTDSTLAEYEQYDYYLYQVKIDDYTDELAKYKLTTDAEYSARIQYYAFDMQHDIYETIKTGDSLPCIIYNYERNYGISPENRFVIGFKRGQGEGERTVTINNRFLAAGTIKFTVTPEYIKHLPVLKN
ncbi:MAG: hypothetical protein JST26_11710 [Bacteroidetes bacterium]|nr:hypothetical protein [Bacteroidota bacterium]